MDNSLRCKLAQKRTEISQLPLLLDVVTSRNYIVLMRARIIRIGNSQGIRIPKVLLEQSRLGIEVELEVDNDRLVISPLHGARDGWDEAFASMAEAGDDALLDEALASQSQWDVDEWQWN